MIFGAAHPLLVPKMYGFLAAFGITQKHPSVIVAETCRTLDRYFPSDGRGVAIDDICVDAAGHLWLFDDRITAQKRPASLTPLKDVMTAPNGDETHIWLGNLGVTPAGKFVFVDRSDHGNPWQLVSEYTLCPRSWGLTLGGTIDRTREFSNELFQVYERGKGNLTNG